MQLLTLLMCAPRFLCTWAQSMQTKTPKVTEAQVDGEVLHSAHSLLPGRARSCFKVWWACLSIAWIVLVA